MSSRTSRRRKNKRMSFLKKQAAVNSELFVEEIGKRLESWAKEVWRRVASAESPKAWDLVEEARRFGLHEDLIPVVVKAIEVEMMRSSRGWGRQKKLKMHGSNIVPAYVVRAALKE